MYGSAGTGLSENTQESEQLRSGKCRRQRSHLGLWPWQRTWESGLVGPEKSGTCMAHLGLGLHRTPGIWAAWTWEVQETYGQPGTACLVQDGPLVAWAWEVHEIHGPPVTELSQSTQELEWLDLRGAHHLGLWQTLCFPFIQGLPTKSRSICLKCSCLSTAQQSKWLWIRSTIAFSY